VSDCLTPNGHFCQIYHDEIILDGMMMMMSALY